MVRCRGSTRLPLLMSIAPTGHPPAASLPRKASLSSRARAWASASAVSWPCRRGQEGSVKSMRAVTKCHRHAPFRHARQVDNLSLGWDTSWLAPQPPTWRLVARCTCSFAPDTSACRCASLCSSLRYSRKDECRARHWGAETVQDCCRWQATLLAMHMPLLLDQTSTQSTSRCNIPPGGIGTGGLGLWGEGGIPLLQLLQTDADVLLPIRTLLLRQHACTSVQGSQKPCHASESERPGMTEEGIAPVAHQPAACPCPPPTHHQSGAVLGVVLQQHMVLGLQLAALLLHGPDGGLLLEDSLHLGLDCLRGYGSRRKGMRAAMVLK